MTKRILYVSMTRPNKNGSGAEQRCASHLEALEKIGVVDTLILCRENDQCTADDIWLGSIGMERNNKRLSVPIFDKNIVRTVFGFSEHVAWLDSADKQILRDRIISRNYEIIFANRVLCANFLVSSLLKDIKNYRIYVDVDDINSDFVYRNIKLKKFSDGVQTLVARTIELFFSKFIEAKVISSSSGVFVCSHEDIKKINGRNPNHIAAILPNITQDKPLPAPKYRNKIDLLFVGSLYYHPNMDGVTWFISEIWEPLRKEFAENITLTIVGRGSDHDIENIRHMPGISFHLNVPDLTPYYSASNACVIPIRYGGGTSIKTIEAMSVGRPVLSTPVGVRGLGIKDGTHYIEFDDAAGFIRACHQLLEDPALGRSLAKAARGVWEESFTQSAVDRIIASTIAG
ncbi:glycosyltransferase [Rhizorhabdus argentea]|uniref:glycosyltransferase n=1 Tax=Rhizorhabdus argentea TaxID=1387174 RepID=UPI0030EF6A21